eukprot:g925.t1
MVSFRLLCLFYILSVLFASASDAKEKKKRKRGSYDIPDQSEFNRLLKQLEDWRNEGSIPRTSDDWYTLGSKMERAAKSQEELNHCEAPLYRALALSPTSVNIIGNLGVVLSRQGKLKDAIKLFKTGLELHPQDARLQKNLKSAMDHRLHKLVMEGGTSDGDPRTPAQKKVKITMRELVEGTGIGAQYSQEMRQAAIDNVLSQRRERMKHRSKDKGEL